jgi:tryptophan synthase alpha chain
MCYANLVLARGVERFADELEKANVSGLIIPDLPLEEAPPVLEACDAAGIALVPLVAPTTPEDRLARIGAQARGFVYTVSVTGTTGERARLDAGDLLARVKVHFEVPVALGFGISTPEQASAAVAAGAEGVIVGTRLVRAAAEGEDVRAVVEGLAAALARPDA